MRTIKLMLTIIFLCTLSINNKLLAQMKLKAPTAEIKVLQKIHVSCNNNTYDIEDWGGMYTVNNTRCNFTKDELSGVNPLQGEQFDTYVSRVRSQFFNKMDSLVYSVFKPGELSVIKSNGGIIRSNYWDAKTGNYIGTHFSIASNLQDIVTIEKIYEIEQLLLNAHFNIGKQNILDPTKKYILL